MARKLKDFTFKNDREELPWDFWFNGEIWEIPHSDVPMYKSLDTFRVQLLVRAKSRGIKARTHIDKERNVVIVRAYPDG